MALAKRTPTLLERSATLSGRSLPMSMEASLVGSLPYQAPIRPASPDRLADRWTSPRRNVRQLPGQRLSRLQLAGNYIMLVFLAFGMLQLLRALVDNVTDLWALNSEAQHIVAYHQQATQTQRQLQSAVRYYRSAQGQQALIRNELGYVGPNEILVKYR
ncbi:MAG: hypothetical protein U0003_03930 [Vampirovibrionales bacterium]